MLPLRTQDFMTGVPAIPGKHLSIELVSKMVCWLTAISYLKATFAKRKYMVSSGERDWNCTRHLEGALRSDQQAARNNLLGIKLHRLCGGIDSWDFSKKSSLYDLLSLNLFHDQRKTTDLNLCSIPWNKLVFQFRLHCKINRMLSSLHIVFWWFAWWMVVFTFWWHMVVSTNEILYCGPSPPTNIE